MDHIIIIFVFAGDQPESDEHEQPPRAAVAEGGTDGPGQSESEHGGGLDETSVPVLGETSSSTASSQQNIPGQTHPDQGIPHREIQPTTLQTPESPDRPEDSSLHQCSTLRLPRSDGKIGHVQPQI